MHAGDGAQRARRAVHYSPCIEDADLRRNMARRGREMVDGQASSEYWLAFRRE